jgi:hypothetical protein
VSLSATLRRAIAVLEGDRRYRDLVEELRIEADQLERRQTVRKQKYGRRPAVVGEKFLWPATGAMDETVEEVVREKAEGDRGIWFCISCGASFTHNLEKDLHCSHSVRTKARRITLELGDTRAAHVLAWRNFQTGHVEVP